MKHLERVKLRAAECLHDWLRPRRPDAGVYLPDLSWAELDQSARQIRRAKRRGWCRAANRLSRRLIRDLNHVSERLSHLAATLQDKLQQPPLPTTADLYRQLSDLESEFGAITCVLGQSELRVTTESIELEGVNLGPFDICVNWSQPDARRPYRIVALEPNPTCSNSSVTHPHVQHEELCEGEGHEAIHAALAEGRIYDFFLVVSRVLATYYADSAYAQLDSWNGLPCTDCGASIHEDDRSYCSSCDETVCDSCVTCCDGCGRGLCSACTSDCEDCGQSSCRSCLEACRKCKADVCRRCLEDQLCRDCYQDQDHEANQHESEDEPAHPNAITAASAGTAVQPDRLGEAFVPAGPG